MIESAMKTTAETTKPAKVVLGMQGLGVVTRYACSTPKEINSLKSGHAELTEISLKFIALFFVDQAEVIPTLL